MPTYYITTLNFAIPFFITLIAIEIFFSKVYNKIMLSEVWILYLVYALV